MTHVDTFVLCKIFLQRYFFAKFPMNAIEKSDHQVVVKNKEYFWSTVIIKIKKKVQKCLFKKVEGIWKATKQL
jgi:hypothetical protein